jgi:hypothetical protein
MPKINIYDELNSINERIIYFKDLIKRCDNIKSDIKQLSPSEMMRIHNIDICDKRRNEYETELVNIQRKIGGLFSDMLNTAKSNKVITNIDDLYNIADVVKNIQNKFIDYENDLTLSLNLARHKIYIYTAFIVKMHFLQNYKKEECPVCYEKPTHIVTTQCNHCFCEECLYGAINSLYNDRFLIKEKNNKPKCPTCRAEF